MRRVHLLVVLVLVLTGAGVVSNGVRLRYFKVDREGNNFVVAWQAEQEQGLHHYELSRTTTYAGVPTKVGEFQPHGPNKPYQYVDNQVYKAVSEQVDYRLEAVYVTGERQIVGEQQINYTPTAIRRTWGSIKAMFQ